MTGPQRRDNKLIREKSHWERRVVELGGPNYVEHAAKMTDLDGNIVAVKKLWGVWELFEKLPAPRKYWTRYGIYKRIDASYYRYKDGEDGVLESVEGPADAVAEWQGMKDIRKEARR